MGSWGVLPGPFSGKQDTTEHTWAEVKSSWAGCLPGSDRTGREGLPGAVCQGDELRELPT